MVPGFNDNEEGIRAIASFLEPFERVHYEMLPYHRLGTQKYEFLGRTPPMGEVKPLPRYPAVSRDLSLVMPESVEVGPLLEDMKVAAGKLLESAGMFDVYRSPVLGPLKKSVSFNFVFRSADHTLTEAEINTAMDAVMTTAAQEKYHAVIRS